MNHTILQAQAEGGMSFFILIGGMFLIMYFFMIRPQVKKQNRSVKNSQKVIRLSPLVAFMGKSWT